MAWTKQQEPEDAKVQLDKLRANIIGSDDDRSKELLKLADAWYLYTPYEMAMAYKAWDEYYETCYVSEQSAIYHDLKDMINKRNVSGMKENIQKLRDYNEKHFFLDKPACIDPYLMMNNQTTSTVIRLTRNAKKQMAIKEAKKSTGIFN